MEVEQDEVLSPRGLESYVPALAEIRAACWAEFSGISRHLLELADYIGLERAVSISVPEFIELQPRIPGDLWRRCAAVSCPLQPVQVDDDRPLFRDCRGRPYTVKSVIAAVAQAMGRIT
jgi:hypothetical protein